MKSLVLLLGLCALLVGCGRTPFSFWKGELGSPFSFEKGEFVEVGVGGGETLSGYYHKETEAMLILKTTKDGSGLLSIPKSKIMVVTGDGKALIGAGPVDSTK